MTRTHALALITAFSLLACGKTSAPVATQPNPTPTTRPNTNLEAETPTVSGWLEITMNANFAKTMIDSVAHFKTSRNACGKDAYGAISSSEDWNNLVTKVNAAVNSRVLPQEKCVPNEAELDSNGYYKKTMDGNVDIKLANGTNREILTHRNGELCTTIADPQISKELLLILNKMVLIADKEDCPNGWGSALR